MPVARPVSSPCRPASPRVAQRRPESPRAVIHITSPCVPQPVPRSPQPAARPALLPAAQFPASFRTLPRAASLHAPLSPSSHAPRSSRRPAPRQRRPSRAPWRAQRAPSSPWFPCPMPPRVTYLPTSGVLPAPHAASRRFFRCPVPRVAPRPVAETRAPQPRAPTPRCCPVVPWSAPCAPSLRGPHPAVRDSRRPGLRSPSSALVLAPVTCESARHATTENICRIGREKAEPCAERRALWHPRKFIWEVRRA